MTTKQLCLSDYYQTQISSCQNRNLNNYLTLILFIYNTETLDIFIHYEIV